MKKIKLISIILFSSLILNMGITFADNIDDLKNQQEEINKKREEVKSKINNAEKKIENVQAEIASLDKKINKTSNELRKVKNSINKVQSDIVITKKELNKAEKNVEDKNDTLNSRLRVMYKNGNVGYVEVLLGSEDFGDLLSRIDMVKRIASQDVELLKYMKEQRDIIANKKVQLENQKKVLTTKQREVQTKKNNLLSANRSKQQMMNDLKKDVKQLEKLEDNLYKQANALNSKIRKLQSSKKFVGGKYVWPTPGHYRITSPYGWRIHPIFKTKKMHTGIDISVGGKYGEPIVATNDGTVILAGWVSGYGNTVVIDHGGGMTSLYGHNQTLKVRVGQQVKAGQVIAGSGSTGNSTGPHLHFEIRKNGRYVNPIPYVKGN